MFETIAIKDLEPDKPKTKEYSAIRKRMEQNLARPEKLHRYATHEAGHLIYLMRTGLIVSPEEAIFKEPTIYWEDEHIYYFVAAVSSQQTTGPTIQYTKEFLDRLALVAVAANVVEETLLGEDDETAIAREGDKRTLLSHCHRARRQNFVTFEGLTMWPCAREKVVEYLGSNRSELEMLVDLTKPLIFERCFGLDMSDVPDPSL